ncbi:MAG: hypothetical protein V4440_14805 [Pseudomonadota bacterium]
MAVVFHYPVEKSAKQFSSIATPSSIIFKPRCTLSYEPFFRQLTIE